jgi:alpha-beta hydrolase superfamily lysophospholipase
MDVFKARQQIHRDLESKLDFKNQALAEFGHFYGLNDLDCDVELLKLVSKRKSRSWVGWHFKNRDEKTRGHALVTHGLFDNSAYMKPLIQSLLDRHLNVLALELPGHGLDFKSDLKCESFNEYSELNEAGVEWVKANNSYLVVEIAHSTGAIGRLNSMLNGDIPKHPIVFLNPLLKIQMFKLARPCFNIFSRLLSGVPRKKAAKGEGSEFLTLRSRDPLQAKKIPMKWIQQYFTWVSSISNLDVINSGEKFLVLLGEQDSVVNPEESSRVLKRQFSNIKLSFYPELGHQPLYGCEREVGELLSEINHWWSAAEINNF